MKTQYSFYFDSEKCIKCRSCEVACQQWKRLPAGTLKLRRVEEVTTGAFPDVTRHFISVSCRHCAKAPCIDACPTKAIAQRPDGIVIVNPAQCIGCRACLEACPFGAPQFGSDGLMQKCDMCLDRLAKGQTPMCAATCPTGALRWGTVAEVANFASQKVVNKLV